MTRHNSRNHSWTRTSCLTSIFIALTATTGHAQTEGERVADRAVLDEVIVTARRQSENLQNTPLAVSAFAADELFSNQIEDLGKLQSHVPNLSLHVGDAANAVIYLRGVGQIDSISFNDPGVGVYVDDVYMGRAQGSFLDVMDPARIEVLRGPQGTLYGRNTIGGAIKFVSARPTNEVEGYVEAGYGNYNQIKAKASLSGPIIADKLMAKAAVAHSSRDGYSQNLFDGEDDFDKESNSWRVSTLLTPTEDLSFYLVVDGSKNSPDHSRTPHTETPIYSVPAGGFVAPTDDPFVVNVNYNTLERLKTFGAALTAEYTINDLTFKSITSYREMDYRTKVDLDGIQDASFGIYDFEDQDQFSQELQLIYQGDRLSLVSGLYYFRENDITFAGANAPDFFVTLPVIGVFPYPIINAGRRDQTNTSQAAYAQLKYDATDKLSLTVGARFTKEKKEVTSAGEEFFGTGVTTAEEMEAVFGTGVGYGRTSFTAENDWNSFSPKIGLDYTVNDDVMVYASASRGFKSGGFNGRLTNRAQSFDPETLWSYEVGLKSTFAEKRVRLNMAGFYNDYKNFQLSRFSANPDTGAFESVFENAGKATIWGLEMEMTALLSDALTLNVNAGYLNSGYDEFLGDFGIDVSDARHLVNAPEFTSRASLTYTQELGDAGTLSINGAVSTRSKTYLTVSSSEVLAQDAFALFEAGIRFTSADQKWDVLLSGQNLTDKKYREHGFDLSAAPGVQLGYYGAPRTYSLTLRYSF
ncbi:TonB-dependent receptor [Paremcibacter congregatus]|uniref:TonB-dependent receptor n=1 Tax=Paremcibacter congregatus TaxID=2043170 RepID=UPI0030ED82D0|tara:strand:- start:2608 stop:4863 length:2256 start_codon:yes stop_codon:yes gene_type:complete